MMKRFGMAAVLCMALAMGGIAGCAQAQTETGSQPQAAAESDAAASEASSSTVGAAEDAAQDAAEATADVPVTAVSMVEGGVIDTADLFTERDLRQGADLSAATGITVQSGQDVTITDEGVYVLSGSAQDATVVVQADENAKVQLVLDGLEISNGSKAAIYVVSADKVFVTTADGSTNTLAVAGEFEAVGDDNVDGVVFAKDDIVFNGTGTLVVESTANGLVGKDDVNVTGGSYQITAANHAIQGKDSVAIADGSFILVAGKDGIHAANGDDDTKGYVYVCGGSFDIQAGSDGIEGDYVVQIDGGSFAIDAAEGIEGTYVQLNGGDVSISASDDGINAPAKSTAFSVPTIEINDGAVTIAMAQGDTDALDANGNLYINGGTVDITAQFAFDFDGEGQLNGGTVTVNGEQVTEVANSMMMGGGRMGGGSQGEDGGFGGFEPGEAPQGDMPQGGMPQGGPGGGPRGGMR